MQMQDLKNTKAIVEHLLRYEPRTRNSDSFLYLRVIEETALNMGLFPYQEMQMSIHKFLLDHRKMGYLPFESVRRARQKLQRKYPELKACKKVEAERVENIKYYQGM